MTESGGIVQVSQAYEHDSSWDDPAPRFRVYLHGSGETSTSGWTDTYDISGADVLQVIDWAQTQAGDKLTYAVALVRDDVQWDRHDPGNGRGLVWLVGMDGNDTAREDPGEREIQRRMLLRRTTPVDIPAHDRAPDGLPHPYVDGIA